jgi:Ca-activated chloride channel family protein
MFADGLGSDSTAAFADYFASSGYQLLVVGVGTEQQEPGLAPLERRSLQQLASEAGGSYFDLTVDDSDMRRIDRRINSHFVVIEDSALPWLDSGYVLVFPAMALFLMWFRRGWTLTWAWLLVPLLLAGTPGPTLAQVEAQGAVEADSPAGRRLAPLQWFIDLWLTSDQQGRALMQMGDYRAAAAQFEDPMWKGLGYYYAEDFMLAAEYFSRRDSDAALFNEANARAQARDYLRAVQRYDRLLERNPDFPGAAHNRQRVQELIDEINRLSESQQQEQGVSGEDKELGSDDAIPAQGAEEITWEQADTITLSAEDILEDPATAQMWMRSVQRDPSDFLAIKFAMQLQREQASGGEAQ